MTAAEAIMGLARLWLVAGGLVAAVFLTLGIDRIDEDARGAYVFRPLLVPGILLIWPLVLWRWWQLETARAQPSARYRPVRASHAFAALSMSVALVLTLAIALWSRQDWPETVAPERLSPPLENAQ